MTWLDEVPWNGEGLIAAVAQDAKSGRVLTVAWMNRDALKETAERKQAVYWSRSRKNSGAKARNPATCRGWSKSGLIATPMRCSCAWNRWAASLVTQGARAAFFQLENGRWVTIDPVLKDLQSYIRSRR